MTSADSLIHRKDDREPLRALFVEDSENDALLLAHKLRRASGAQGAFACLERITPSQQGCLITAVIYPRPFSSLGAGSPDMLGLSSAPNPALMKYS